MSALSYVELQAASPRTRDYARTVREAGCPECHHDSVVVTQAMVATRIDPACWAGYCTCGSDFQEAKQHGLLPCRDCADDHDPRYCDEPLTDETCECPCHCQCQFEA